MKLRQLDKILICGSIDVDEIQTCIATIDKQFVALNRPTQPPRRVGCC